MGGAVPGRSSSDVVGPNRSVVDDYPDIRCAPMWQQSNVPIPPYWFLPPVTQPVYVPPVPPPPPPPKPRIPCTVEWQTMLVSAISDTYYDPATRTYSPYPGEGASYPYGPTAVATLDDGTTFAAVQMFTNNNDNSDDGWIRMWHLDYQGNVLGQHDELWPPNSLSGNPTPIAVKTSGGLVSLLVDSVSNPNSSSAYLYGTDRGFDTGSGYDMGNPPADPSLLVWGLRANLSPVGYSYGYALDPNYNQIDATNTTAMVCTSIQPWVPSFVGQTINTIEFYTDYQVTVGNPPASRWRLYDKRLAYGSDTIASGHGRDVLDETSIDGSGQTLFQLDRAVTPTQMAALEDALIAGAVGVAFDPSDSGLRRVSGLYLTLRLSSQ